MPRDLELETSLRPRAAYVGPPVRPLARQTEAALQRYHPTLRRRIRRFAVVAKPCADLLVSFPAATVLIATAERGAEATGRAVARVKGGAPLPAAAEALGLPLWMRKLPPEAFDPAPIGAFATDAEFARRIVNLLPSPTEAAMWLRWLVEALRVGDEPFALWLAAQRIYAGPALPARAMEPLAAFAFASHRAGAAKDPLLGKRWHERRPMPQACALTVAWLSRVINARCAVEDGVDGWRQTTRLGGFQFKPLTEAAELKEEASAMRNCLDTYVDAVERGDCRIFAVRRGKRSVADLELRPRAKEGAFYLVQLEGPGNGPADDRVRRAVERWMATLGPCPLKRGLLRRGRLDPTRWRAEWEAFVAARPAVSAAWREARPEEAVAALSEQIGWLKVAAQRHAAACR